MIRGGSCIVGPLGEILAGPAFDAPAVLVADLDLAAIPAARYDLDVVGHSSRPDVFQLVVNTEPRSPVRFSSAVDLGSGPAPAVAGSSQPGSCP